MQNNGEHIKQDIFKDFYEILFDMTPFGMNHMI